MTVLATSVLLASSVSATTHVSELSAQLKNGPDFRLRVQAALQLGKSEDPAALRPLLAALSDPNVSVRAAAAAALQTLGDRRAVSVLKEHRLDRSEPVRTQIQAAITALEAAPPRDKPKLLVSLGSVNNATRVTSPSIERTILSTSRQTLDELPGVHVLPNDGEVVAAAEKQDIPVVLLTTRIQKLAVSREGTLLVYSANIEYIVHTLPDQTIAARISGSASATASEGEAKDKQKSADLRREVLEAAIRSALKRSPPALLAAARL